MKMLTIGVCTLAMLTAFGCSETAPKGRETAASTENTSQPTVTVKKPVIEEPSAGDANKQSVVEKPIAGEADKTFSLSVPFESVALTQGEEKSVLIGINRGENFHEEVTIDVADLPAGVTLAATAPSIEHGSMDATLKFKAASDAALGDFTVMVTGHTVSSSADFSKELKLTVAEK